MPSLLRRDFAGSLFPPVPHRPVVAWHTLSIYSVFSLPNREACLRPCEIRVDRLKDSIVAGYRRTSNRAKPAMSAPCNPDDLL